MTQFTGKLAKRLARGGAALAITAGVLAFGAPGAGATPAPAFYTYQAPGGQSTAGRRVIALTFDDGPGPYTPAVLKVLQRYHVPATFFEIGENVAAYPQYTKLLAQAGYPVEDHTWTHPDLTKIPASDYGYQIDQTQAKITSITGVAPTCVRPPYDAFDTAVLQQLAARHLTAMSYSVDPRDWSTPGTQAIVDRVVGSAFPGAVVDMHDGGGPRGETVAALPQIITALRSQGYQFVSICGAGPLGPQRSVVYGFGSEAGANGSINSNPGFVGVSAGPNSGGSWLVTSDEGINAFKAHFYGSLAGHHLPSPAVGIASTPDGDGYWILASDGRVYPFGDAVYHGSAEGLKLTTPFVGIAPDPATGGYWLLSDNGGVDAYHAPFYGSRAGKTGPYHFFGIASSPDGGGYVLAGERAQ
ncbi:MAG: polysaccharide deacetylase family protein [Acidimicrobiales bacterium]